MKNELENELGKIIISEELLATLAGVTAVECFGLAGMASRKLKDGLAELLGRDNLSRGVAVHLDGDKLTVDLHVVVVYGTRIQEVAANVIKNVKRAMESQTGLTVARINVHVQGVRLPEK
jgi:uncharacterized alkaline shock family protein YloU